MDLYLNKGTARNAVIWFLHFMGVITLLWISSIDANAAQMGNDYLYPQQAKGGFISSPLSTQSTQSSSSKSSSKSTTVSYQAFDGSTYQLLENRGRYVNVLLPQSYTDGPFFSADHIVELVDRLDMLYVIYTELLHHEPGGSGLLTVAFVAQTCGMGCGLIGARGFEILSDQRNYEAIIHELDAGRLESVLLHEMAHNFDAYSTFLHYLPDHAHAWTDMFEYFAPNRYARVSSNGEAPDDRYNSPVSAVWKNYVLEESADWQQCVKNGSCADLGLPANSLWAMLYYRVEALHGTEAILGSFQFLDNYIKTHAPPSSDEAKESVRILSLANGAGVNIACYMDSLKWPIQSSTRSELKRTFGEQNQWCADMDGDGFNAINGDCDDSDASIHIAATEISANGVDDDCDELVDESTLVEWNAGSALDNFGISEQTRLPFEVEGTSHNPDDRDAFRFSVQASGRVRATLCAKGEFNGWAVALDANGAYLEANNWFVYISGAGCSSTTFDFGTGTAAGILVIPDDSQGEYSLQVTPAQELLPDYSSIMQLVSNPAGGMTLQISDDGGFLSGLGADEVEVWVSGVGVQTFTPFFANTSVAINRKSIPGLRDGETYQVRIRPRADGLPLAEFSAGYLFQYDESAAGLPSIDHRFSGAWYDIEHDGEGFVIEVLEDNRALVYWFTYHDDGSQRWMLGVGGIDGNRITINELLDTHGGRFGANFNPADVVTNDIGSLSISFLDCSTALINYSVDDNGAHLSTSRLTNITGLGCSDQSTAPERGISGSWFDPSHDGEGYIIEQIDVDKAMVIWFTYNDAGEQSWMLSVAGIENNKIHMPLLLQPEGGIFGRSFDPETVVNRIWGELDLNLSCSSGAASYKSTTAGFSNGSQTLSRLTTPVGVSCSD